MPLTRFFHGLRSGPAEDRLARFRKVLTYAQNIPRYARCLRRANLHSARAVAAVRSVEDSLRHFAVIDLDDFRGAHADFITARAPVAAPQKFFNPLKHRAKVAVLMEDFEENGGVRVFDGDSLASLDRYQPEIIAAPVRMLRHLAVSMQPPKHAVVAFTGIGETLDSRDRDLFWRIFQVPLFEQYIGLDGRVIARECEIHEGLHLVEEHAVIEQHDGEQLLLTSLTDFRRPTLRLNTGYAGTIERVLCECGRAEPRLMGVTPVRRPPAYARKAVA